MKYNKKAGEGREYSPALRRKTWMDLTLYIDTLLYQIWGACQADNFYKARFYWVVGRITKILGGGKCRAFLSFKCV